MKRGVKTTLISAGTGIACLALGLFVGYVVGLAHMFHIQSLMELQGVNDPKVQACLGEKMASCMPHDRECWRESWEACRLHNLDSLLSSK